MLEKLRRRNRGLKATRLFAEELETREVPAALNLVPPGTGVNGDTQESELSATGRYVAFSTLGTNVVSGVTDANGAAASDVYLFDRVAGTTKLISRSSTSATTTRAPAPASRRAQARPMPLAPPVTRARFPDRSSASEAQAVGRGVTLVMRRTYEEPPRAPMWSRHTIP